MAERISDKKKKQVIADYLEKGSFRAVGRMHGISADSVKRICQKNDDFMQKAADKKRQNSEEILSHMEQQKADVCNLLDEYLKALKDPKKIERAGVIQIATAMGIIIDKYTAAANQDRSLDRLDEVLEKIGGVI